MSKTYEKTNEEAEDQPAQSVMVRNRVEDVLENLRTLCTQQFNAEATVDKANCQASADVVVQDQILLTSVPVTTLLTLEKDLKQVRETLNSLPVLDPTHQWKKDQAAGIYKTGELKTNRTAKKPKVVVLYPATDKHPAQTQLLQEDVTVGQWVTVQASGAISLDDKKRMVQRCDVLLDAIKVSREEANSIKTSEVEVGAKLFDFILG